MFLSIALHRTKIIVFLSAAKSVLALEIANDPLVRKAMRRDWEMRAAVTVKPTDRGYDIIDDLHPLHVCTRYKCFSLSTDLAL